ncbi:MAG: GC-type dockerin domain-anchored protein [Planctomycetota bacterium]|nr:GC-type dockerin domain-anchored protein [Planctomycetota bacterium]
MSTPRLRLCLLALVDFNAVNPVASAQPCEPRWDATPGTPGVTSGYIGPIFAWDDGAGKRLYVGGSAESIGGTGINFLARYNPATNTFSRLGAGISGGNTNAFITSMTPFNPATPGAGEELFVGGFFASAGGVMGTRSIASWNGTRWAGLATNWTTARPDAVWAMKVWNNVLYVGGGFPDVGGVASPGLAAWDGESWQSVNTGAFTGFSPAVFALEVFDDGTGPALYVGGRFDSIGPLTPGLLARWNGSSWSRVGNNLAPANFLSDVSAMTIFDDGTGAALYVGGSNFLVDGVATSTAKWNGQTWTRVGGDNLGGRTTTFAVWDDGSGPALYAGGTAQPGIAYVYRLENGVWQTVAGGFASQPGVPPSSFASVFGMGVLDDRLYIGGNFVQLNQGGLGARGLVARVGCPPCAADFNRDGQADLFDYLDFVAAFAAEEPRADFNASGQVDLFDYLDFAAAFASGC